MKMQNVLHNSIFHLKNNAMDGTLCTFNALKLYCPMCVLCKLCIHAIESLRTIQFESVLILFTANFHIIITLSTHTDSTFHSMNANIININLYQVLKIQNLYLYIMNTIVYINMSAFSILHI